MLKHPSPEDLTSEQSEVLEKATFLIISAKKEAAAMLRRQEWNCLMTASGLEIRATRTSKGMATAGVTITMAMVGPV
jgi:hypothetical protein